MKYFEVTFHIAPYSQDAADVLSAMLADEGFEAFDTQGDTLLGWVQQHLYAEEGMLRAIKAVPFPDVKIEHQVREAQDENWNKLWEEEGFIPIIIYGDEGESTDTHNPAPTDASLPLIVIHDTAHMDVPQAKYDICINPCQAFGTGSHETTRMILSQLLTMPMQGRSVIDAGTGTGILSILCRMLGAGEILAYDIDEWSVRNAQANLALGGITQGVEVLLGDGDVLEGHTASLLMANINRNILLADMPRFAKSIETGGELLLSGFYTTDVPMLLEAATSLGFTLSHQREDHEWAMLLLKKENHPA